MAAGPPAAPCAPCSKPWRPSRTAASSGRTATGALERRTAITFPGHSEATPVVKFPLPEVVMIPRHVRAGGIEGLAEAQLGARLSTPIAADVIDSLPDGPAEDSRLAQRFTIVVEATGVDGDRAECLDFLAPHGVRWTIDTADAGRASA